MSYLDMQKIVSLRVLRFTQVSELQVVVKVLFAELNKLLF